MKYYPVNLNISGRNCLVVGGGGVASRKVYSLLDCGARVTVVSPELNRNLEALSERPDVTLHKRPYQSGDLKGHFLVIGATNDMELNRRISADAEGREMLCNIADVPDACNFILPSVVRQGDLVLAISTSGKSPAFAKHLRKSLQNAYGPEYARLLRLMGGIRKRLLEQQHAPEAHKPLFERLIESDLLQLLRNKDTCAINRLLGRVLGEGFDYDTLMAENEDRETGA
ncbi:MAG TPA: bifunctional precorrin-2 dehydrogenase/sirohydrochlorin ferrochelatase [Desulfosalsimonadaceae bacterium]|nr:bifunctional precorrin-2 dehydrogenase/sirohydrochlorin ferrochelatase [Desulfosalsimonadaceae bacterium]